MIKKVLMSVVAVSVVAGLLLGSNVMSYLSTSYERVSETVENSVPTEFQIDRARKMVRDLEPEIERSMYVIANEEVEVAKLDERIEKSETKAVKEKSEIMRLQSHLQTGKSVFKTAGHSYSVKQVKEDLTRRFTRFKTSDATIGSLRDMRDARQRNLEAARQKLSAMMSSQRQLLVEVENLEAKLKLVEVAQASSDLCLNDSQLARAKELMSSIRTKLNVAAKLANADTSFHDEIPLDGPVAENITDQVAEYFSAGDLEESAITVASFVE